MARRFIGKYKRGERQMKDKEAEARIQQLEAEVQELRERLRVYEAPLSLDRN